MNPRIQKQNPHHDTENQVIAHLVNIQPLQQDHEDEHDGRRHEHSDLDVGRIENSDYQDAAEVVDYGQRHQEHLQRNRNPVAE